MEHDMGRCNDEQLIDNCKFEQYLDPFAQLKINASLVFHKNRLYCAYRTDHLYNYDAKNQLTELDHNFQPITHKKIIPLNGNTAFEDIRLFSFNNDLIAIYTCLPHYKKNGWKWTYQIGIGVIETDHGALTKQQNLKKHSTRSNEKNWVPFLYNDQLNLISDYDPYFRVLKVTGKPGNFKFEETFCSSKVCQWDFGEIRGGTPLVRSRRNDSWYYGFVHSYELVQNDDALKRKYHYTAIRYSPDLLKIEIYDKPLDYPRLENNDYTLLWYLGTRDCSIECVFPMGIIPYNKGVILSYGKDDCVSRLKYFSWNFLYSLFE